MSGRAFMRPLPFVVLGFAVLGATAYQARGLGRPEQAPAPTPTARPSVAAEGRVVTYDGAEAIVSAERGGRLLRVLVAENDRVKKGDLLAEIESAEIAAALEEARAAVRQAEAELALASVAAARRRELAREGIAATHDLDVAEADLATRKAQRETASAAVQRLEAQLSKSRILAPLDGVVVARHVQPGERVESGQRAFVVANLSRLRVAGEADEADSGALSVGAPVVVTSDAYPGRRFAGRVETIADAVTVRRLKSDDPARPTDARVIGVKVAFDGPTPLKLGTTVELRIEAR